MSDRVNGQGNLVSPPPASEPTSRGAGRLTMLRRLGHKCSSLLVFGVLGGLLVWGHHTGWTIPKFSTLTGHGDEDQSDWCSEHNVPESKCVECNPDLLPKPKCFGWCDTHGVHDCPLCNPEVAQLKERPQPNVVRLARLKRLEPGPWPANNSKCLLHDAASSLRRRRRWRRPGSKWKRPRPAR